MQYKQLILPNLDPILYQPDENGGQYALSDWLGMCETFVEQAYGFKYLFYSAWAAWNGAKYRHADRNIPTGVFVPIYFDGWWNGARLGHVAIYKDGVVWSAPYTHKPYADKLGSIAEVERIYGMTYVGWSEDMGGTRVIEGIGGDEMISDKDNEYWRWNKLGQQIRGRSLTRAEFRKSAVGKTWLRAMEILSDDKEADKATDAQTVGAMAVKDKWQQQIYDLRAALNKSNAALDAAVKAGIGAGDLKKQLADAQTSNTKLVQQVDQLNANQDAARATGNAFVQWIGQLFNSLKGGK
ncbi:hypothetical protein [Rhodococcus qingshengii]|uniref:hypothetical protein n=1 Tax=Rhodococcus qingshengii TaxID=334542 RepID=UPI002941C89F|nr:hypothetical protein [Rhodococcus qingshengii]WOI86004.1 hypothetical protein R0122_22760 [Rhodococcus qingshengii]